MSTHIPRLTQQSLRVLKVFSVAPGTRHAGTDIMKLTRIASGTLYPILRRFEASGLLTSAWERGSSATLARPLRKWYSLTVEGRSVAHQALNELSDRSITFRDRTIAWDRANGKKGGRPKGKR